MQVHASSKGRKTMLVAAHRVCAPSPQHFSSVYKKQCHTLANIFKCNLITPRLGLGFRTSIWPMHLKGKFNSLELGYRKTHSWDFPVDPLVKNLPMHPEIRELPREH